jgi:hypothetical protein
MTNGFNAERHDDAPTNVRSQYRVGVASASAGQNDLVSP